MKRQMQIHIRSTKEDWTRTNRNRWHCCKDSKRFNRWGITNFVEKSKQDYQKLFITVNSHGFYEEDKISDEVVRSYGKIVTHDEHLSNDKYIRLLNKLSHEHAIRIETLIGQCYSHMYDKESVSIQGKLTVYATTTRENPESIITIAPV